MAVDLMQTPWRFQGPIYSKISGLMTLTAELFLASVLLRQILQTGPWTVHRYAATFQVICCLFTAALPWFLERVWSSNIQKTLTALGANAETEEFIRSLTGFITFLASISIMTVTTTLAVLVL